MATANHNSDSTSQGTSVIVALQLSRGKALWRRALGVIVMLLALSMVLAAMRYFAFAQDYSGYEREVETNHAVFLWYFAVFGLVACFLRRIFARTPIAVIGLGYSALQFANAIHRNSFRDEMIGTDDLTWRWGLALSLIMLAALRMYDRCQNRLPQVWHGATRHFSAALIAVWLVIIIVIALMPFVFLIYHLGRGAFP